MAEKEEGTAVRLVRFIALGAPGFCRVLAVAFVVAALALAFFDIGGVEEGTRADLAMLFGALALAALGLGRALPWVLARFLPRR